MSSPQTLLSPEQSQTTACVIADGPLGLVYVQALDAYGFQRELSLVRDLDIRTEHFGHYLLKAYMHPGRRDETYLSATQAAAFVARIDVICREYPQTLFGKGEARNGGFVRLCEMIHRGRWPMTFWKFSDSPTQRNPRSVSHP